MKKKFDKSDLKRVGRNVLAVVGGITIAVVLLLGGLTMVSQTGSHDSKIAIEDLGGDGGSSDVWSSGSSGQEAIKAPMDETMFAYNGRTFMETSKFNETYDKVKALIEKYDGRISTENLGSHEREFSDEDYRYAYIWAEVDADDFFKFSDELSAIDGVAVTSRSLSGADVSESYLSIESRISLKQEMLKVLQDQFDATEDASARTSLMENIIEIREDIAQLEESKEDYGEDVAKSDMYISINEVSPLTISSLGASYTSKLAAAFMSGWNLIVGFLSGLLLLAVRLWAFIVLIAVFVLIYKRDKIRARRVLKGDRAQAVADREAEKSAPAATVSSERACAYAKEKYGKDFHVLYVYPPHVVADHADTCTCYRLESHDHDISVSVAVPDNGDPAFMI